MLETFLQSRCLEFPILIFFTKASKFDFLEKSGIETRYKILNLGIKMLDWLYGYAYLLPLYIPTNSLGERKYRAHLIVLSILITVIIKYKKQFFLSHY